MSEATSMIPARFDWRLLRSENATIQMLRFGICTQEDYLRAGTRRRFSGSRVAYHLLEVADHPSEDQIRVFEDISFTLRTSNGTLRTTFPKRFRDVDEAAMRWIQRFYPPETELRVQDRAASSGLTSWEWAEPLLRAFPRAEFEASDVLLYLVKFSLPTGEIYIIEPDGKPLQYIQPPFVVSLDYRESWRFPINRMIATRAKQRLKRLVTAGPNGYQVANIPLVHPAARAFIDRNPRFQFRQRSVFEHMPDACHVLRTMNIFNRAYFSAEQLAEGGAAARATVKPGGIWIVGRTLEEDFTNHVTFLRRQEHGWEVLEQIGHGSEMAELALRL